MSTRGGVIEPDNKNAVSDLPLLTALGGYLVCVLSSLIFELTSRGLVRQVAHILIGAVALWLIPLWYGGRSYSLRDDRRMKVAALAFNALSDEEVPRHPAWWRESGEPSRRVIRVALWVAAGLSLAAAVSFVAAPSAMTGSAPVDGHESAPASFVEVLGLACWISPFLILWNVRSVRRERFRQKLEEVLRGSGLESIRNTRKTLRAEVETYETRLRSVKEPSIAKLHLLIENLERQIRTDQAKAGRRELLFAVGGLAAGLILSIITHRAGLT